MDPNTDNEALDSGRSSDMAGPESPKANAEGRSTFPPGTIAKLVGTRYMTYRPKSIACSYRFKHTF